MCISTIFSYYCVMLQNMIITPVDNIAAVMVLYFVMKSMDSKRNI